MRRHRERIIRIREKEKMESDLAKTFMEEIRYNKDQSWKVAYYSVIIYAGLFAVINFFNEKINKEILKYIAMEYYIIALLTSSISNKMLVRLMSNIIVSKRMVAESSKSNFTLSFYYMFTHRAIEFEYFGGIFFALFIGYAFCIVYIYSLYGINIVFIFVLTAYLPVEALILYSRYKDNVSGSYYLKFDIVIAVIYFITILIVHALFNYKTILEWVGQLSK